eukprot:Opistho-2@61229
MYWRMRPLFMPISATGRASVRNSCSIETALAMISRTRSLLGLFLRRLNMRHAKSQWRPSSRLMSSLEKVRPGMSPRFLSQKMAANDPLKKMPSTAANAMMRSAKEALLWLIHRIAHSAFLRTHGSVSTALKSLARSWLSRMYVSIRRLYISEWMFSIAI